MPQWAKRMLSGLLFGLIAGVFLLIAYASDALLRLWWVVPISGAGMALLFLVLGDHGSAKLLSWLDRNSNRLP